MNRAIADLMGHGAFKEMRLSSLKDNECKKMLVIMEKLISSIKQPAQPEQWSNARIVA